MLDEAMRVIIDLYLFPCTMAVSIDIHHHQFKFVPLSISKINHSRPTVSDYHSAGECADAAPAVLVGLELAAVSSRRSWLLLGVSVRPARQRSFS